MNSKHQPSWTLDRRAFFKYVGAGSAACALTVSCQQIGEAPAAQAKSSAAIFTKPFQSPPYPVPLPTDAASDDAQRLANFEVTDTVNLPDAFEYRVIAGWGDTFGAAGHEVVFGTNNDYTGLLPIANKPGEFYLFVNHEYLSALPWLQGYATHRGDMPYEVRIKPGAPTDSAQAVLTLGDVTLPGLYIAVDVESRGAYSEAQLTKMDDISQRILDDLGVSILHVKRESNGHFTVINDSSQHKRIAGHKGYNIKGQNPFEFTGPTAMLFDQAPRGTFGGCSGGTSSWGTFFTCEENFQDVVQEFTDASGLPLKEKLYLAFGPGRTPEGAVDFELGLPLHIVGQGSAIKDPLDGRHYGWVCEVDPTTGHMRKHTAMGRFRHENVAFRCETGKPLAAYMGDDRRGGHTWKFVSKDIVADPKAPETSRLFEQGTLYVAQFQSGFKGTWLPLLPETPVVKPDPAKSASGHFLLPKFPEGGHIAVGSGERAQISVEDWTKSVEAFSGKPFAETLAGDLVKVPETIAADQQQNYRQAVLLLDAFAYANAIGGTPTARPEDLEVHPKDHSVYIAYTDFTGGSDGGPDPAIFEFANAKSSQRFGGIYRIQETDDQPGATTFGWGMFVNSGEVHENGGGFACPDNLAFDAEGNLWFVTDITTSAQNYPVSREPGSGTTPGDKYFTGIFGNNAMFVVPEKGPNAGIPVLFAVGPTESEFTGPTFTEDSKTLVLSVQHPGERMGTRRSELPSVEANFKIAGRDGVLFDQKRSLPTGSNWPAGKLDTPPRPCVVSITEKA